MRTSVWFMRRGWMETNGRLTNENVRVVHEPWSDEQGTRMLTNENVRVVHEPWLDEQGTRMLANTERPCGWRQRNASPQESFVWLMSRDWTIRGAWSNGYRTSVWHMSRDWMNKAAGFSNGLSGGVIEQTVLDMKYGLSLGYKILQLPRTDRRSYALWPYWSLFKIHFWKTLHNREKRISRMQESYFV
jgi:hypothetical protein